MCLLDMTGTFPPKIWLPKKDPEKSNGKILVNMGEGNSWGLLQRLRRKVSQGMLKVDENVFNSEQSLIGYLIPSSQS